MAVASAMVISTIAVVQPPAAAAATAEETSVANGLVELLDAIAGLADFDELGDVIPGTDLLPASQDALDLLAVIDEITGAIEALPDKTTGAVEGALDGLNGSSLGAGVTLEIDSAVSTTQVSFETLRLRRTVSAPLAITEGEPGTADSFSLAGGSLTGELLLDLTSGGPLVASVDSGSHDIFLVDPGTITFSADLAFAGTFTARLGILDVEVSDHDATNDIPAAAASVDIAVDWLDPDGDGRISRFELQNSAPADLFDASVTGGSLQLDVALSAGLQGLGDVTGTVLLDDQDPSDGFDAPDFELGELGNFTNFTAQDVLAAIAQLAINIRGLQLKFGSVDIPLVDENLAELANMADGISRLFTDNGLALPDNPMDLDIDQSLIENLDTLEEIVAALESSLGVDPGELGLEYLPDDDVVTFDIDVADNFFHDTDPETPGDQPPTAAINVADELAGIGITGLGLAGGASISVTPSYDLSLTVGLDLSGDLADPAIPITRRIFLQVDDEPELGFDAPIAGNLDLTGTLSFLELQLADSVDGPVDLLARRQGDPDSPMLSVDIDTDNASGRITLEDLFDALGGADVTTSGNAVTVTGDGITVTGLLNAAIPALTLDATATIGETELGAGATIGVAWPDVTVGAPDLTVSDEFVDDFLSFNLDNEDPLALFTQILAAVEAAFGTMQALDQNGDAAGLIDDELPIVGTSMKDALEFLGDVRDSLNSLSSDPAGSIQELEIKAEAVILQALDQLDGVVDYSVPVLPVPSDFGTGEDYDADAFEAAVNTYLDQLQTYVSANADFLKLRYEPGTSPGAIIVEFNLGICSDLAEYADDGCTFAHPISQPFNVDLGSFGGGLVAADGAGTVAVDYNVAARAHIGVQLPDVTPNPGGLPTITPATDPLFVLDSSGISASIGGFADASFGASVGPFEVIVGDDVGVGESDADCGNSTDDDGDGVANDGCPPDGVPETGVQCTDTVDNGEDDSDESDPDGVVNDGCPEVANPLQAQAGAAFTLANDLPGDGVQRTSDIAGFLNGLDGSFAANASVTCGDASPPAPFIGCADLPISIDTDGAGGQDPTYLGTIALRASDFDNVTVTGAEDVFDNLLLEGEGFLFQLLADGINEFGGYVERALSADEYDVEIPVLGDLLDAGADVGSTFNGAMQDLSGLIGSLDSAGDFPAVESAVQDFFWNAFGPAGADVLLHPADIITDGAATAPEKSDIVVTLKCGDAGSPVDCDPSEDGAAHTMLDLVDVQVEFKLGQVAGAQTPDFDFGVPGLRLAGGEDALSATVDWQLNVGFGISLSDGFYLLTSRSIDAADGTDGTAAGEDIQVRATVDLGTPVGSDEALDPNPIPPAFTGDLAFIGVDVYNAKDDRADGGDDGRNGHEVTLDLSVDIPDPGPSDNRLGLTELVSGLDPRDWRVSLDAEIDLLLNLVTSMDFGSGEDAGLPRILSDLSLQWEIHAQLGALEGGESRLDVGDLQVGFDNVRLDLGSFISEFLAPALAEVQRLTKPLQPIIDTLRAPIPGVAELAELVGAEPITLLQLMEAVSGADLALIKRLLDVLALVNSIPTNPGSVVIPIGGFGLDSLALSKPELPANAKAALISSENVDAGAANGGVLTQLAGAGSSNFGNQITKATGPDGGFTFPAFQDPSQLFQLLVGKDVTLVHFDAGKLKASVSKSFSFGPIALGPIPVSVVVSISAAVEGRFAMGYDTKGIRLMVKNVTDDDPSNDGFFTNVGVLFAGVFLDDLDANGVDVPEIRLTLEGAVGAAVDLVIVKAGVEAGLRATLDLNLHDGGFVNPIPPENLDGKLRIDEIIQILSGNPICLFDVSGRLEAFIRIFVTIDLFLFSTTFRQTIVNIVLLELENITKDLCQPPPPKLATVVGDGVLALNMGERAGMRDYDEENETENFTVRQISEGTSGVDVRVTAFGITQDYTGVNAVVGSGADGKDKITAEPGAIAGVCQEDGSVQPPVGRDCEGDPATDEDDAETGETVEVPIEFQIKAHFCGGGGEDTLSGGSGSDLLVGNGALDNVGNPTTCSVNGSTGDDPDGIDKVTGNGGDDTIHGNLEADDLNGNAGNDTIHGGDGDDQVTGGPGRDTLHGNAHNDSILGGPEADPCPGDDRDECSADADDVINGNAGIDTIEGDHGKDTISGGADADIVVAGFGDDTVNGDGGHDQLFGNEGWDTVNGGADDDDVVGGTGEDTLAGNAGNDDIIGEEGDDTIDGGAGLDVILGDKGSVNRAPGVGGFDLADPSLPLVTLVAGPATGNVDTIDGGDDADRIWGQEGGDGIHGGAGNDIARGNGGDDTISGDAGADELLGDDGADTIHGDDATGSHGAGDLDDTIRGGNGNDTIEGNAAGDRIFGDAGRDTVFGDATAEAACGVDGGDRILGGPDGDVLFGNSAEDTVFGEGGVDRIIGGSDTAGVCDTNDHLFGGEGTDVLAGDNATIGDALDDGQPVADDMLVMLFRDGEGAGDEISGDAADDRLFGQTGTDTIGGGAGDDYAEGNEDSDTIAGDGGADDLIGGSSADDGIIDDDRAGNGESDVGDTIDGGPGIDWIAGDNAVITRNVPAEERAGVELFDVATTDDAAAPGAGGVDTINGGDADDRIFGQTAGDIIHGDGGDDYVEGNDGDDTIHGDAGDDDLVGGGSADDGVIDRDRVGTTLLDVGEALISGGPGEDYITGDNALVNRNVPSEVPDEIEIVLFDVFTVDEDAADPDTSGGDLIHGDAGPDWIFGQGADDTLEGDDGHDYVEGNEGDDAIAGGEGDDDLVGGSSADDGFVTWDRMGNGLRDGGETLISGGPGQDWIAGDNALVNRNRPAVGPDEGDTRAPIELFDVETVDGPEVSTATSGGDLIDGGADGDRIFGQGNGDQLAAQTDPGDGRNNDFVGSAPGDDDFDRNTVEPAGLDEDQAAWEGDTIHGGTGDDEIEGGHGNDLLLGNAPAANAAVDDDEDDIVGGGSADDGRIFDDERLNNGGTLLDGDDTIHGDGADATVGDDDVVLGDNGWIVRTGATQTGPGPDGATVDLPNRELRMEDEAPAGTFGNDYVAGNGGHDDIVGQAGDDSLNGEYGSDAVVGDLGRVTVDLVVEGSDDEGCGTHRTIAPEQPFYEREICVPGTLFRLVELQSFEDQSSDVVSGEDVVLGGDGDDWIHGGPGVDMLQGDGDGGAEIQDPEFTYTETITDPNPASADSDRIFGGDSNGEGTVTAETLGDGDVIWGGRGEDHLYGGHGADIIDVRPPDGGPYPETWTAWGEADVETYHGIDFSWGGFGRDAVQSNVAGNGPVPGDRVVDFVGVYNLSLLCPATYGAYITIRAQSPKEIAYWEQAAAADGAYDVLDKRSSGYDELSMIYKPDIRHNNGKAYPSTPGHFFGCN